MDYLKPPRAFNYKYDRRQSGLWVGTLDPGSWTPNRISGIVEYWDFSDTSKITASGGVVSAVAGQKGVYSLTQGASSPRPITGTRNINGLNVLDFDGINDVLIASITTITQPVTYLAVYQNDTTANDQRVIDSSGRMLYDASFATSSGKRIMFAGTTVAGSTTGTTNAEQAVITFNGASSQTWINGVSDITGTPGTNQTGNSLFVGTDNNGLSPFDGRIAFIGLVSGVVSSTDRALWNTWCSRWGL